MLILQTLILIDLFRQGKGGCKFFKKLLLKQTHKPTFLLEPLSIIKAELIIWKSDKWDHLPFSRIEYIKQSLTLSSV